MQDKEKDYETIYNELQEYLVGTDDDYKLQVYDELLQTGSVTVFDEEDNGHYFSFREFRHEILDEKESIYEPLDLDEIEIGINSKTESGDK